jgi:hypothetical protein
MGKIVQSTMAYVGLIRAKDKKEKTRVKNRIKPGRILKDFMFLLSEKKCIYTYPHPPVVYKTDNINKFILVGLWIISG